MRICFPESRISQGARVARGAVLLGRECVSARAGENNGHVVGLLGAANPVTHSKQDFIGDAIERLSSVFTNQLDQSRFAKFTKLVFGFGDSVAVCEEDVAAPEL